MKVKSLKRILSKLNDEILTLEHDNLLSLNEAEASHLSRESKNIRNMLMEEYKQLKQDAFVIEMIIIEEKVIKKTL